MITLTAGPVRGADSFIKRSSAQTTDRPGRRRSRSHGVLVGVADKGGDGVGQKAGRADRHPRLPRQRRLAALAGLHVEADSTRHALPAARSQEIEGLHSAGLGAYGGAPLQSWRKLERWALLRPAGEAGAVLR